MSVENKQSHIMLMYKGRLIKVGILVFFSLLMMVLYVSFFQHPPPDELLANNRKSHLSSGHYDFGESLFGSNDDTGEENDALNDDDDDNSSDESEDDKENEDNASDSDDEDDEEKNNDDDKDDTEDDSDKRKQVDNQAKKSYSNSKSDKGKAKDDILSHKKRELGNSEEIENADYWAKLLKQQNLVPIGAVYNKCDGKRIQLGTVVLMEDKENGGIKARTYVNITLEHTIDGGQFNIDSRYNGRSMYDNYWELCEVEDDLPDEEKTFTCPLKPGSYSRVKDKPIPGFLPKTVKYCTKLLRLREEAEKYAVLVKNKFECLYVEEADATRDIDQQWDCLKEATEKTNEEFLPRVNREA
ncbi:phosphatidylglycerol/phosphatidylinositol transfer protein [Elysia marginata]|uniref:Phosphatidylglycerol/phosphatidylinositol transfer protein n=1 Tax=Elysia marginata TaxID=1093978 RepID=A0AAV4GBU8_9GAST|nr:phosphatidylglycerol/phosphatidylinositol transfer protein [Elysia marginata]